MTSPSRTELDQLIRSPLTQSADGLWRLRAHEAFGYSDSQAHEKYLLHVCSTARDLGSDSRELEAHIFDWVSEYHLSRQRANLLRSLRFPTDSYAVEIGCGCGALTRFLGETYARVVGIEGSVPRARIARARTRDLGSTDIVAAPFQDLEVAEPADLLFCIGVYEYAGRFVSGADPFHTMLSQMASLLKPDGHLVLAIENQFGLKYWNGSTEDHVGRQFEGIEGYLTSGGAIRTFGRMEIERLIREYFADCRFFYPIPDYKSPRAVMSEDLLGQPGAAELIAHTSERDYRRTAKRRLNRRQALKQIERNKLLHIWADSFLVIAKREGSIGDDVAPLGVIYSTNRRAGFGVRTVVSAEAQSIVTTKEPEGEPVSSWLRFRACRVPWVGGDSLLVLAERALLAGPSRRNEYHAILARWVNLLQARCEDTPNETTHLDFTLDNIRQENATGALAVIDDEWTSERRVPLAAVLVRGVSKFYRAVLAEPGGSRTLHGKNVAMNIRRDLATAGIIVGARQFLAFLELEAAISKEVYGRRPWRVLASELLFLLSYRLYRGSRSVAELVMTSNRLLRKLYWSLRQSTTDSVAQDGAGSGGSHTQR